MDYAMQPLMTVYASQSFIKRLGFSVSWPDQKLVQGQTMDGWRGDILKVSRIGEVAVMMHDASLATLIIPMKGVRSFEIFLPIVLKRVSELFTSLTATFDAANQSVVVLRRNNRRLIGSLNDAKYLITETMMDQLEKGVPIDWNEAEHFINHTPFSVIDYELPMKKLASLIAENAQ